MRPPIAHIETVQTGIRVITHVRGRVYRQQQPSIRREQTLEKRIAPKAAKRRKVCLLDAKAGEWLQDFGISQPCFGPLCNHQHFTRDRIEPLVKAGDLKWIGESKNVAAWRNPRTLVVRKSAGMPCVQLRAVGC